MNEKLALILDFNFLESSNLSLIEFITLLKINYDQIDLEINNNVLNNLQEKQFIKIVKDENEKIIILREKSKLLIDFLLIEGLNDSYKEKKITKKSSRVLNDGFDNFITEYRSLWKGLKVGSMGSHNSCSDKLSRWLKENTQYSKEDVLKAARIYINSLDNYQYLQQADYFIYKKDAHGESSRLSAFIDETEVNNTDWTSKLN
jgi:hypothetical protein